MKVQARFNESVGSLLFHHLGTDDDDTERAFYALNPTQTTPFLTPKQEVVLPSETERTPQKKHIIEVWE
ncbi:hypothetical protein HC752_21840 [Vibrio sp. S9_S30]|uniref:hypothetical protein n=1 Tax=Vibrio sp. S9_S30 TaxID=2720226 RepID=UPI0016816EA0|nr:hypothetical protein [Vibrio sp. S9_S30]MBD1559589.1 hypothetical protein [Vibrio sp. S9_S30]